MVHIIEGVFDAIFPIILSLCIILFILAFESQQKCYRWKFDGFWIIGHSSHLTGAQPNLQIQNGIFHPLILGKLYY
jgi:hypothetical protein